MAGTFSFGGAATGTSNAGPWPSLEVASTTGTTFPTGNTNSDGNEVIYIQSVNITGHGTGGAGVYFGATTNASTAVGGMVSAGHAVTPGTHSFMACINAGSSAVSWSRGTGGTTYDNHGDVFTAQMCGSVQWATVPSVPSSLAQRVTGNTTNITIDMGTSTDQGGSAITEYHVQWATSGVAYSTLYAGPAKDFVIASPVGAGQPLALRVFAINGVGNSNFRNAATITMPSVPSGMAKPTVSLLSPTSVRVAFSAPSSNGGSGVTGYNIVQDGAVVQSGVTSDATITGLASGSTHVFQVEAVNAWGASAASPGTTVTLSSAPSVPAAPTGAATSASSIQWSWTAPADNGSPITSYTLQVFQGGTSVEVITGITGTTFTTGSLLLSTAYTAEVLAVNAAGASSYSAASAAVTTLAGNYPPAFTLVDNSSSIFHVNVAAPTAYPGTSTLAAGIEIQVATSSTFTTGLQTYTSSLTAPQTIALGTGSGDGLIWVPATYYFIRAAVKYNTGSYSTFSDYLSLVYGGGADGQVGNGTSFVVAQAYVGDGVNWRPITPFVGDGSTWQPLT